ncbi:transmembrane protein 225 [Molossus molossus]|uniref:Transmembrane protein 225 n=1 Tax=Molossus molossus TaxID=27622 RepID=A0A7J8C0F2_MOLMO|nr:transmembrane protein 225 [Molossus molossus]KAF6404309.1 transmembrane protein 225 [Molossus molossus]
MVHLSTRNVQAINMFFSSWALLLLASGVMLNNWVIINSETKTNKKSHSPWMTTTIWPKGDLEVVRIMMMIVLGSACFQNFFLGLQFTYMIPQTKYVYFMSVFLSFSIGTLLLSSLLLYQQKLKQGQSVYYFSYKITWIIFTAYLSVSFIFCSGIFSFLEYKQSVNTCTCQTTITNSARESQDTQQSDSSNQVIPLPEQISIPRSIVHMNTEDSKEGFPKASQIQKRRVTWAL